MEEVGGSLSIPLDPTTASLSFHEFTSNYLYSVQYFRSMLSYLSEKNIDDYRLKIKNNSEDRSFSVKLSIGKEHKMGPRNFPYCLSCDSERAIIAECNYEGGEALRGPEGGKFQNKFLN